MEDGSDLNQFMSQNQQPQDVKENEMVNEILLKIKENETSNNQQMPPQQMPPQQMPPQQMPPQQMPPQQMPPQQMPPQQMPPQQMPPQQMPPQDVSPSNVILNDPIPNSTLHNTIDPAISSIAIENQGHAKNMENKEDPPSINMFEIPKDVNFSLTDLLWKELRGPIIVGLLTFLALLPYSKLLLQKYIPVIGNSDPFTMTLKAFTIAILYYILTKISLL